MLLHPQAFTKLISLYMTTKGFHRLLKPHSPQCPVKIQTLIYLPVWKQDTSKCHHWDNKKVTTKYEEKGMGEKN